MSHSDGTHVPRRIQFGDLIDPNDPRIAYDGRTHNPERIELVLEVLREAWVRNPSHRLGQLLSNAASRMTTTGVVSEQTIWNLEEDEWVDGLRRAGWRLP